MKVPSNMKELLQWFENKKKARKPHHIEMLKIYGECNPDEYPLGCGGMAVWLNRLKSSSRLLITE